MDPVSLLLVQAVSPIALGSDVVRSGRPGGVDPLKSVLKGPLSGPSHREVAGVEFAGWSGNASHTSISVCAVGEVGVGRDPFSKTFPSKAKDRDVLLPLLLLFGAFSQEAGVTRSS